MKQKNCKDAMQKRQLVTLVAGVLLFIGIFSFLYWFIAFPLVWSALPVQGWPPFWFNIYSGVAFLVWAAVVAVALFVLWHHRDKIVPVQSDPISVGAPGWVADGPVYPTKLALIQPEAVSDETQKVHEKLCKSSDRDVSVSLRSILAPVDDDMSSQDNSSTQSLQTVIPNTQDKKENNPVDISRKVIPAKNNLKKISCTESESSIDTTSVVPSSSEEIEQNSNEQSGVMLRKKPNLKLQISKENQDSKPAPLSPRELFFKDLLRIADQAPPRARSQEVAWDPKHRFDSRKSMPASTLHGLSTSPIDNSARVVAQSPKSAQPAVARLRTSSEEYFIAQVSPTRSETSEVHLFISDHNNTDAPAIQWKLVSASSDTSDDSRSPHVEVTNNFIINERRHALSVRESEERTFDDSVF